MWGDLGDKDRSEDDNVLYLNPKVGNYGERSLVSQFVDPQGKFAFAYDFGESSDDINIRKADGTTITLKKAGPLFGAVIQDSDGFYYAVTGKRNGDANSANADVSGKYDMIVNTVFITKYTSYGELVKTTKFVGNLTSISGSRTQNPFRSGNCAVAINNGVLVCSYARQMYNGQTWLTSNAVVEPQLVSIGKGRFVVLWEEHGKAVTTYYMVLDDNGKKLVDKTSLGNIRLHDNEDPVWAEGAVHWVSEEAGVLLHYELKF